MSISSRKRLHLGLAAIMAAALILPGCPKGPVTPVDLHGQDAEAALDGMRLRDKELDTLSVWGIVTFSGPQGDGLANFVAHIDRQGFLRLEFVDPFFMPVMILTLTNDSMQILDLRTGVMYICAADAGSMQRLTGIDLEPRLLFPALTGRLRFDDSAPEVRAAAGGKIIAAQGEMTCTLDPELYLLTTLISPMENSKSTEARMSDIGLFRGVPLATKIACSNADTQDRQGVFNIDLTIEEVRINPKLNRDIFTLGVGEGIEIRDVQ